MNVNILFYGAGAIGSILSRQNYIPIIYRSLFPFPFVCCC